MPDLFGNEPADDHAITAGRFAQVALEQGIDAAPAGLTYRVPDKLADLKVGDRVLVPLGRGNQSVSGYITELLEACDVPAAKLKPIAGRDPHDVGLPPDLIELARWIAAYYVCPLGMVFAAMLPAAVKRGAGIRHDLYVKPPEGAPPPHAIDPARGKLSKLQRAVYEVALQHPDALEIKHLADLAGARSITPVKQLIAKGLLQQHRQQVVRAAWSDALRQFADYPPIMLNDAQRRALDALLARIPTGFGVHLLHGVTGSGKTEVYLQLIEHVLHQSAGAADRGSGPSKIQNPKSPTAWPGAIILVPEIALTPQTVARFLGRFSIEKVAVLHSALTAAQRHEQWRRIRDGQARIVVGARSAVFAPLDHLGLIIVDEEHESSYKQDQLPRYHARDVAIRRAQLLGIPVVLGSATPSLESYFNALGFGADGKAAGGRRQAEGADDQESGASHHPSSISHHPQLPPKPAWHYLHLPQRVAQLQLPKVELVDLREERRKRMEYTGKGGVHLLSVRLEVVLRQTLEAGGQAMLLLNRRGYANYIACPDHRCGWMMTCAFCDATMVYHKDARLPAGGLLRCHHCEAEQLLPSLCPVCSRKVTVFGLGTQRVEEEITRKFPGLALPVDDGTGVQTQELPGAGAGIVRMDSDAMRSGRDYEAVLEAFRKGQVKVLLGTQMIAKGLDFPNVRLVGVISGDTALHLPDFRAAERSFQLIAQVAGRAGRGEHPGRVIVQTWNPDDPVIQLAAKHDYAGFAARELALRAAAALPPIARMARIVVRDKDHVACHERAAVLFNHLRAAAARLDVRVRLRGPAPCPIARIAEFHRVQIELVAAAAASLQRLLTDLRNSRLLISDARTAVDVDPVDLL
jgi:primosomal protein N' (replication factor Y)